MSTGSPFATEFENGSGFSIDDDIGSAWFVLPTYSNGLPDEDGRVLVAQLTTDGELDGVLYLQILPAGNGLLAEVVELPFYGACDGSDLEQCPEEIEAVTSGGCVWEFEVSDFQAGESATWSFGDDVVQGGHYAEYAFGGDGEFPVSVAFSSNFCPQGVTLQTTVDVIGCDPLWTEVGGKGHRNGKFTITTECVFSIVAALDNVITKRPGGGLTGLKITHLKFPDATTGGHGFDLLWALFQIRPITRAIKWQFNHFSEQPISCGKNLQIQDPIKFSIRGQLSHQHPPVLIRQAIGICREDKPSAANVIVNGKARPVLKLRCKGAACAHDQLGARLAQ
jgi:hypothetical protein